MARQIRDVRLETRNARRALKVQAKPYWRSLDKGLHLGYRRRQNGGSWIVRRFSEAGKYFESKLGLADDFQDADGIKTLDYGQAQASARQWHHRVVRMDAGMEDMHSGPYTVADAMYDYLEHYKIEGKGLSTATTNINAHILPVFGELQVDRLTSKRISEWQQGLASRPARLRSRKNVEKLNTRKLSNDPDVIRGRRATANRIFTVLKAGLNYAWKQGKVPNDLAWRRVKPFKNVSAPVIRYLSEAECRRLVNACPSDLRLMVQAALFTGCRYSELTRLAASDFDFGSGTLAIRISKSGKPRHVVLTEEGREFFEQRVIGKQASDLIFTHDNKSSWGESHQCRPLKEACGRAKIKPEISFHILRHTYGSMLAMSGTPMPVIAKQLGHADTRMTEKHYAHVSPSYVADTIRQNFPTLGIVEKNNIRNMGHSR